MHSLHVAHFRQASASRPRFPYLDAQMPRFVMYGVYGTLLSAHLALCPPTDFSLTARFDDDAGILPRLGKLYVELARSYFSSQLGQGTEKRS